MNYNLLAQCVYIFLCNFYTTFLSGQAVAHSTFHSLPCPLIWTEFQNSNKATLSHAVRVSHESSLAEGELILRAKVLGKWTIGQMLSDSSAIFVGADGKLHQKSEFQLLTNPDNCTINWLPKLEQTTNSSCNHLSMTMNNTGCTFLGRFLNPETGKYVACTVQRCGAQSRTGKCPEILESTTEIVPFLLDHMPETELKETFRLQIGEISHIYNKGDTELRRRVVFTEKTISTLSFAIQVDVHLAPFIDICSGKNCQSPAIIILPLVPPAAVTLQMRIYLQVGLSLSLGIDARLTLTSTEIDSRTIEVVVPPETVVQLCPVLVTKKTKKSFKLSGRLPKSLLESNCITNNARDILLNSFRVMNKTNEFIHVEDKESHTLVSEKLDSLELFVLPVNSWGGSCEMLSSLVNGSKWNSKPQLDKLLSTRLF